MAMRLGCVRSGQRDILVVEARGQLVDVVGLAALERTCVPEARDLLGDGDARAAVNDMIAGAPAEHLSRCRVTAGSSLPPVRPRQVIAIGLNYRSHADEMGRPYPAEPVVFSKAPSSVVGHMDPVVLPPGQGRIDYEGEIAVVVGRTAGRVPARDVGSVIAGFTLLNDVTMRDVQGRASSGGLPWFLSKSPDTFCPLGPFLVPAEDAGDPSDLSFTVVVNGETRQRGWTGDLIFSIPELVEYVTRFITLEPGDIIATGTPSGVGPLEPGDVVTVESPVLGRLQNPVCGGG